MTDRFTVALERLGSSELYVRIGGVHALEHVMHDSAEHHNDVIEVLIGFIRDRAPRRESQSDRQVWMHPVTGSVPDLPAVATPDIQAALTALGHRPQRVRLAIDLSGLHLVGADLTDADLRGAQLTGADLSVAKLVRANLTGTLLDRANLTGADLEHRHGASEGCTARWQAPQPGTHHPADTVRAQPADQADVLTTRRDPPPVKLAEKLPEQERVAAGRPLAAVTKPGSASAASTCPASTAIACSLSRPG